MKNKYDVIIIGAGIGGLVCGCYLAKAGMKVLIVEKNDRVGGCCVSFKRKNFKFDAGAHIIGSCGKNQILGNILKQLNLKIDLIKFDPTDRINFPGHRIDVAENKDDFMSFLKKEFHTESCNIDKFFGLVSEAQNNLVAANLFKKYKHTTYKDLLGSFFKSPRLKNILCFGCGYLGLPPSQVSALSVLFLLRSYLFEGAYYPKGGAQVFSDSIANKFKEYGGRIVLKKKVKKIICKDRVVKGVVFGKNNFIESHYVVSNADCRETFYELLGVENIRNDRKFSWKLNGYTTSISFFVIYMAIKKGYDLQGKNGWYFESYDLEREFNKQIYLHIPTLVDTSVAPRDKNIIEMGTTFPFHFNKINNWKEVKEAQTMEKIDLLAKILPGIKNYIEFYDSATPMTIYKYTSNDRGALYGWEQSPGQVFTNAFPLTTSSINNLILAGHWTFPGGGVVSVAISGVNAAKKILRKKLNAERSNVR